MPVSRAKDSAAPDGSLRVAIVGAGGIGCYYGVRLMQAGHHVTLVARGKHLAVMQAQGLTLEHPDCRYRGAVTALDMPSLTRRHRPSDFDLLLLCVKANATEILSGQIEQWFVASSEETAVVSLQNGVDNEAQLAARLGETSVIGGLAVRIGGHITRPGHVEATGPAQIVWGAWPDGRSGSAARREASLRRWTELFNAAGIPTRRVDDIRRELWRKLVINNGVNPLSALTGLDTRTLSHHPELGPMVRALMAEAAAAAAADGVMLGEEDVEEMFLLIREFDAIKTSMLVDREKGRPLELDPISGAVIERCRRLGIDAPYTKSVVALLRHSLDRSGGG